MQTPILFQKISVFSIRDHDSGRHLTIGPKFKVRNIPLSHILLL